MQREFSASESVEHFIKAVYKLQQEIERVSTNALKDELNITAPSVTDMAKRLVKDDLLDYRKYHGMRLTATGEAMALQIIRRHRLIELYLVTELGYQLHEVHEEADGLEHAVSSRFIEAISDKLGHPKFDPHGDPIPAADGAIAQRDLQPLSTMPLAQPAQISRLIAPNDEMLQYILDRGFALNSQVQVTARDPYDGPVTVQLNGASTVIGFNIAEVILVEIL